MIETDFPVNPEECVADGGGLYIHVAYCRRKCIYCDFFSAGQRIADWHRYVDALCSEFSHRLCELAWPLRTVYIGGGTPSLMPDIEFRRLCDFLRPYLDGVEEFTLEVNPDDVDVDRLKDWKRAGVTRLSMGIQTFDNDVLKVIGRRHDGETALEAYGMARREFGNISIDLMFGLPGQTMETWRNDVQTALHLRPEHISAYSLMYENGTALTALRDLGRVAECPDELSEEMFMLLANALRSSGYERYEISNFALPGYCSRHNSSYWLQKPYIGLGPSAHSYDGRSMRKANRADLRGYLEHWAPVGDRRTDVCNDSLSIMEVESLSDIELIEEYVMTRMRMRAGIPFSDFRRRFGDAALDKLVSRCQSLSQQGLVEISCSGVRLSERAVLLSDSVILELASFC